MDIFALGMLAFLLCLLLFVAFFMKKSHRKHSKHPDVSSASALIAAQSESEKEGVHKDLAALERHVRKLGHQGYSKEAILKKLTAVGWHEHLVDLVLYEVHKPHNRLKALEQYVHQQLLKAKPKEIIKENLLSAGWDEEVVDIALGFEPRDEEHFAGEKEAAA